VGQASPRIQLPKPAVHFYFCACQQFYSRPLLWLNTLVTNHCGTTYHLSKLCSGSSRNLNQIIADSESWLGWASPCFCQHGANRLALPLESPIKIRARARDLEATSGWGSFSCC